MKNPRRKGMTFLEVTIVSGLMVFLVVMLSAVWTGVGRPALDHVIRVRVLREMAAAADALARDLGGYLADPEARQDDLRQYRWIDWQFTGGRLQLCYDAGDEPNHQADWATPDKVIIYEKEQEGENLLRTDQTNSKTTYIARYLTDFEVSEEEDHIRLSMTFSHRGFERSCTLLFPKPPW